MNPAFRIGWNTFVAWGALLDAAYTSLPMKRLPSWIKKRHKQTLTDFSLLEDWNDLLVLTGHVSYDHLLVIISARPGTLSYDSSFEKLPRQLGKYFSNNSFIVLYPNQSGEPLDTSFFSKLYTDTETRHYEKVGKWFYRWFKKEG